MRNNKNLTVKIFESMAAAGLVGFVFSALQLIWAQGRITRIQSAASEMC